MMLGRIDKKEVVQRFKHKSHPGVCQNFIIKEVPKQNYIKHSIDSGIYFGRRINLNDTKGSEPE